MKSLATSAFQSLRTPHDRETPKIRRGEPLRIGECRLEGQRCLGGLASLEERLAPHRLGIGGERAARMSGELLRERLGGRRVVAA